MSALGIPSDLPRATLLAKDLAPWTPDIDARKNDKAAIISGRNFRDRVDGPTSDWSSEFVNYNLWDAASRAKVSQLPIGNGFLYGTPTGVWKINPVSLVAELLLGAPEVTITNLLWPWTIAFVGNLYYLAQYDIGLWQYDPITETLKHISTPAGNIIRGVTADHGRLVYISDTVVAISALDDGTDLVPDLASGAGAQTLSVVGRPAYKVQSLERDGFLVFTRQGILKGNYTTAAYAYTYEERFLNVKVFSADGCALIPGQGIVSLDSNGFWLTGDNNYTSFGKPQPWEPEKSDYIKNNILNGLNLNLVGTVQLFYSNALQCLFVSFSSNLLPGFFQYTMVHDTISKRWSTFDQPHYGIFETFDAVNNIYTCSFMETNGYMKAFSNTDFSEDYPAPPVQLNDFVARPSLTDEGSRRITDPNLNGGLMFENVYTTLLGSDVNPFYFHNYSATGVYEVNSEVFSDTNNPSGDPPADVMVDPIMVFTNLDMYISGVIELFAVPYIVPEKGLDSNIVVGPWRFNDTKAFAEETSHIESVLVGCQSVNGFEITEDWNILTGAEDWNTLSGMEDWSAGSANPNNYDLSMMSSDDNNTTPIQGIEQLPVFAERISTKLYKPSGWDGIYHSLTFSATDKGQAFAIKTLDLTANYTGVLQNG